MKRFLKRFVLMAVATVGVVACTEADVEADVVAPEYGTTLYASVATPPETKVGFEDNGTEGIALTWEVGDEFTLYDIYDDEVGTFTCEDAESGVFKGSVTLVAASTYTAKYNEDATLAEQNGDEINNLDAACKMSATFTYGTDETITFEHEMAIMTFVFESEETPSKLIFENGEDTYTILYSEIEPVGGIYISHIMIEPCEATDRTLTFGLYDSDGTAYDIRTVSTSKAYKAGYRYTATVSDIAVTGSESNPYLISTAEQLRQLSTDVNSGRTYEGEYFLMTNDINLGGIDKSGEGIAENEFNAIGNSSNSFRGTFDGGGYEVSGLYINQPEISYQGLFGYVNGATIKNLGVSGSISGSSYVGGVVGTARFSIVTACHNTGEVSGSSSYVGGVVGSASNVIVSGSTVTECYNSGEVSGSSSVGGVVGAAPYYSTVTACYNTGVVSGDSYYVGGVVGSSYSVVTACYNTGEVSGSSKYAGGVVGYASYSSTVTACYNTGEVSGSSNVGGVVGSVSESTVTACYNTGEVSGSDDVDGVAGNAYASTVTACYYMLGVSSYGTRVALDGLNSAVAEMNSAAEALYFTANSGNVLPSLFDEQIVYEGEEIIDNMTISSLYDLKAFRDLVNSGYAPITATLTADINLGGESWTPIGISANRCNTIFDGGGHTISGLYINSSEESYQGLFGYVKGGTIKNLKVKEPNVTGYEYVGAICSYLDQGEISDCAVEGGTVSGSGYYVGGVVGYVGSYSTVTECYNTGEVSGSSNYVGGVVGYAYSYSTVTACYNTGEVSGSGYTGVGGVIGSARSSTVTECHNTGEVSGSSYCYYVGGVIGFVEYSSAVTTCYNTGAVSGSNYVGGVAGSAYFSSSVTSSIVTACYNMGAVSGSSYVGGVAGYSDFTVTACYNTGEVSGSSYVGGVIGRVYASTVTNSYYNSTVYSGGKAVGSNADSTIRDVEGKTTEEMTASDFVETLNGATDDDYWTADSTPNINSGYPILIWQE